MGWLKILSVILDIISAIICIFSSYSWISQRMSTGLIPLLSFIALVLFSLIFWVECLRTRKIEALRNEKPFLDSEQIYFKAVSPIYKAAKVFSDTDTMEWEQKQREIIKKADGKYTGLETTLFIFGVALIIVIVFLICYGIN